MKLPLRNSKFTPFLIAGLLLSFGASGSALPSKVATSPKKILMWKAVNGSNVVYLLGSIHVGSKRMYPLPKVVEDAFARSKVLVVEVNINKLDQPAMQQTVMKQGMYTGDDSLWKHIQPETAATVKKFFAAYGMPEEAAGKMKPWLVGILAEVLPFTKSGMDPKLGIDEHFLTLAEGHKKIEQVETAAFQLGLLSHLPDKLDDIYLSSTLGEISKEQGSVEKLVNIWLSGDASKLAETMSEPPIPLRPMERALLQDRNPNMADFAEKFLHGGGPCFFVVGAAHLVGYEGVVNILQQRGYSVVQMSAN